MSNRHVIEATDRLTAQFRLPEILAMIDETAESQGIDRIAVIAELTGKTAVGLVGRNISPGRRAQRLSAWNEYLRTLRRQQPAGEEDDPLGTEILHGIQLGVKTAMWSKYSDAPGKGQSRRKRSRRAA